MVKGAQTLVSAGQELIGGFCTLQVAAKIAAAIAGEPAPRGYDGAGFCYVEVGEGMAVYGSGDFFAFPGPRVTLETPTREARQAKEGYEQLLDAWFDNR